MENINTIAFKRLKNVLLYIFYSSTDALKILTSLSHVKAISAFSCFGGTHVDNSSLNAFNDLIPSQDYVLALRPAMNQLN